MLWICALLPFQQNTILQGKELLNSLININVFSSLLQYKQKLQPVNHSVLTPLHLHGALPSQHTHTYKNVETNVDCLHWASC